MAIHPIDLQTLYAQMEKVGRQQGAEQQRAAIAQDAQQQQNKLEAEKKLSTVQNIDKGNQEGLKISKDGRRSSSDENLNDKKEEYIEDGIDDNKIEGYIKDPNLGQRVDISG